MISSAYKLCSQLMRTITIPAAEEWNIYPFHFSDGEQLVDG